MIVAAARTEALVLVLWVLGAAVVWVVLESLVEWLGRRRSAGRYRRKESGGE